MVFNTPLFFGRVYPEDHPGPSHRNPGDRFTLLPAIHVLQVSQPNHIILMLKLLILVSWYYSIGISILTVWFSCLAPVCLWHNRWSAVAIVLCIISSFLNLLSNQTKQWCSAVASGNENIVFLVRSDYLYGWNSTFSFITFNVVYGRHALIQFKKDIGMQVIGMK